MAQPKDETGQPAGAQQGQAQGAEKAEPERTEGEKEVKEKEEAELSQPKTYVVDPDINKSQTKLENQMRSRGWTRLC